jgi:uncharacterized Zn finger protein
MTTNGERVASTCPSCSPELETVHEVLSPGGQVTVRCTDCDHVHKTRLPEADTVERVVVVSQDGESVTARTEAPAEETVAVGEEFLLDTDTAIMTVRITSLELDGERRVEEAQVRDVETFWTRAVGNVTVNTTVHPKEGTGNRADTYSTELYVPGDYEFEVGTVDELGDEEFTVQGIYLREDARGYDFDKLDEDGDTAVAKDCKRLYVRDETTTAWSAW